MLSDETKREIERIILKEIAKESEMPEEIFNLIDILVKNGCPLKSVLISMNDFGEYLSHKRDMEIDKDVVEQMLKDLKWREDK